MIQEIFLPFRFPGLNDHDNANRANKYAGAKMKREWTDIVTMLAKAKLHPVKSPVWLSFLWAEPDRRRDPDNIVFAKKYILDGFKEAGIIPNDNMRWIQGWQDIWIVTENKAQVGVVVTINEPQEEKDGGAKDKV